MEQYRDILLLESSLAATSIATGLTSLRGYDFSAKGRFFTGFFSYTIGLERLLKLSVVLDFYLEHGKAPGPDALKSISHDLSKLVSHGRQVAAMRNFDIDTACFDDELVQQIVDFASRFATSTRYFNLDAIVGRRTKSATEPLAEWDRTVCAEIIRRHYRETRAHREKIQAGKHFKHAAGFVVHHVACDGSAISDTETLAQHENTTEVKQKYSVLYLHQVVEFAISLLEKLDFGLGGAPLNLAETFQTISVVSRRMVLGRKRWEPYL